MGEVKITLILGAAPMVDDEFVLLSALVVTTFLLISCAPSGTVASSRAAMVMQAQFEQQVEEGFGRIDLLPNDWAMMPGP
jgi:hypothetical protein